MSFCYLYLNTTYKFQNHGEQFLRFSYLYLTAVIHREQIPRNPELFWTLCSGITKDKGCEYKKRLYPKNCFSG